MTLQVEEAIFLAVDDKDVGALREALFLSKGRHPNLLAQDSRGRTAFMIACERGCSEVLNVLLVSLKQAAEAGMVTSEAMDNLLNGGKPFLLSCASDYGNVDCVEALLTNLILEINGEVAAGALCRATIRGHCRVISCLLSHCGSRIQSFLAASRSSNSDDSKREQPLHIAVEQNRSEALRLMLQFPQLLDVNELNITNGATALITAAIFARVEIVKLLLEHPSIDVNFNPDGLGTALYCAASTGLAEAVVYELLQAPNIDVNLEESTSGKTPLIAAARCGNEAVVNMLLDFQIIEGNIAEFVDEDYDFVNESAAKNTRSAFEEDSSVDEDEDREGEIEGEEIGYQRCTRCNVNKSTFDGETALMAAAVRGHDKCVGVILSQRRVDVNLQNVFGSTALALAARKGHLECVRLLASCPKLKWVAQQGKIINSAASDEIKEILRNRAAQAPQTEANCGDSLTFWGYLSPLKIS